MPFPGPHAAQLAEHAGLPLLADARRVVAPPAAAPRPDVTVYGYLPYWVDDVTAAQLTGLTHLAIFAAGVDDDGNLTSVSNWTSRAGDDVPLAHSYGVKVHLTVINFDDDSMSALLGSSTARANAVSQIAEQVNAYGADGVNIDFEGLPSSRRDEFTMFIRDLQDAVDEVWLALPAVDWSGAYDYSELAAASQGLFIMGYGYHWTGGSPGPNDPLEGSDLWGSYSLDWSVQDYRDAGTPDDKIVLGLPLYGQVWPVADNTVPTSATDDGWSITMVSVEEEVDAYGREFDASSQCAYYRPSGEQVWYDDTETVRTRIRWAAAQGLAGVGFWALGYETTDFWPMMAEETTSEVVDEPGDTASGDSADPGEDAGGENAKPPRATTLNGEEGGCGCASGSGAPWLGLFALGAFRRRR